MADHESQLDPPADSSVSLRSAADGGSSAAPWTGLPADAERRLPTPNGGEGSSHRRKASESDLDVASAPLPLLTDKTVISKRPPLETPLRQLPTSQSLGEALIGKTLDHYELVEFVGGGGMGAVFRSIDTRLGRTVAVKVLSRDHTDEETIKRFRNEAQSAARLDHPNIARVYFVGEADGWNYIVFEYIEGTNLRDIVESGGPLPLEEALNYTLQVTQALEHASNRDVVHRDIKPSNVLVTPSGEVKLVDMGLARLHQVESSSEDLTASGVMLGTFDYISPEQARDPRSADVRSDIYSLGCTLYFMLAGRPPFPEGTAVQKLLKHNSEEPPDLRLFQPELPRQVAALVGRMLAKRPSQRPQSPRQLSYEIQSLAEQLGLAGLAQQSVVVLPPAAGISLWRRVLPIAVPTAALVLVLWGIDMISRQGEKPLVAMQRPKLAQPLPLSGSRAGGDSDPLDDEVPVAPTTGAARVTEQTTAVPIEQSSTVQGDAAGNRTANGAGVGASSAPGIQTTEDDDLHASLTADVAYSAGEQASGRLSAAAEIIGGQLSDRDEVVSAPPAIASPSSVQPKQFAKVVVRPKSEAASDAADVQVVDTLARACQVAAVYGISEIELQFDGPREEQPFDLSLPKARIFAGDGFHPVILFRPQPSSSQREQQMIRLTGGSRSQVSFENVELRLELPSIPSSSGGWALLSLYQIQTLDLRNCVLTVKDLAGNTEVGMLALQPYRPAEMTKMMDDMMALLPSINVNLTSCVARGEATFLLANEERPLKLFWDQGLLVTPQRLLDAGGSMLPKPSDQDKFQIQLRHVTAVVPAGLVRQERRSGAPSQQRLEVSCDNSLLAVDENNFWFDFRGLNSRDDIKLEFDGERNLYPSGKQRRFLRLETASGSVEAIESIRSWNRASDRADGKATWLRQPPRFTAKPAHQHGLEDYRLDPVSELGGFDPLEMAAVERAFESSQEVLPDASSVERLMD